MKRSLILAFMCISSWFYVVIAQPVPAKETITGSVIDINGTPLKNAIIVVDGEETDVKTDEDGNFQIKVRKSAESIGVVAFGTGFIEQEIDGRSSFDFAFTKESVDLTDFTEKSEEEKGLLSMGYNKVKPKYSADAVGFLDVEHSKKKYYSIQQILMETPGLIFVNGTYAVAGSSTLGAYVPPLYVLDGMALNTIPNLTPSEVSTVTVLKGSAAAIYGSRAFGGVVIFTTRIP